MGLFSIFSNKSAKIKEYKAKGAVIVDVRSSGEFAGGYVAGAVNIPLNQLTQRMDEISKLNKPVVFCCASGVRSAKATAVAKNAGIDGINGGGWRSVDNAWM